MNLKTYVGISFLATILFLQEQLLTFLPNVSFTFLLMLVYCKYLSRKQIFILIVIYVLLDQMFYGGLNPLFYFFTLIAWFIVALVFKKNIDKSTFTLALVSVFNSFVYSTVLIIPGVLYTKSNFMVYLINDIPFQVILSMSSLITVLFLYESLIKIIDKANIFKTFSLK